MVATNTMANKSSLELMLDKLQQLEDQPEDIPPALPVRPVSRARLPRARLPLQLELHRRKCKENDGIALEHVKFDHFQNRMQLFGKNSKDVSENRISNIQKCYRGYKVRCYYKELRRGVIELQSFIRGENARKCYYQCRKKQGLIEEDTKDCTKVQHCVLIDLRKRVLRTEAKVREKKEENVALKTKLREIEKKWEQYEEKMNSLEKKWQDQLTNIQECLAAAKKNRAPRQSDSTLGHYLDFSIDSIYQQVDQHEEVNNHNEVGLEHGGNKLCPQDELRKLKLKFKAWKKDYKNKLRDTQSMLKKLGNSETAKSQKNWWGKISH